MKLPEVTISTRDLLPLWRTVDQAKKRFGPSDDCGVVSSHEAGRDSFWLHRAPVSKGG